MEPKQPARIIIHIMVHYHQNQVILCQLQPISVHLENRRIRKKKEERKNNKYIGKHNIFIMR
jgi:hypothetical protein